MTTNISVCFILDHTLKDYRLPFFCGLAEKGYYVTVFHTGEKIANGLAIEEVIVKKIRLFGFEYRVLPKLNKFGIVVHMQNLRIVNLWILSFNPFRRFKLVHWGIGTSSAQGLRLHKSVISWIRNLLARCASAQVLYSEHPLKLFSNQVQRKSFIANNTIFNPESKDFSGVQKDSAIFIGTLNSRKGLDVLIMAFDEYLRRRKPRYICNLLIIGSGPERDQLITLPEYRRNSRYIRFVGNKTDSQEKSYFFRSAAICISPKQAGLSVLESFSYGVPFLTFRDAISGGEHLNIMNGVNGFLVRDRDELVTAIEKLDDSPELARKMGNAAYVYYHTYRNMNTMINEFITVFEYVID